MRAMYRILVALSLALLVQGNRVLHHPVPDYADVHQPVQSDDVNLPDDFDYDYGHTNLGQSIGLGSLSGLSRIHERGLARGSGSNLLGGLGAFSGLQGNRVLHQPVQSDYVDVHKPVQSDYVDVDQPVDFDYDSGHTNLG